MLCVVKKKAGANVPLFAPDKVTQIESLWQRTFLIPDVRHHQMKHARHRGNGVRPTSCPFQVPSTRFWSKQTANFLKRSGANPGYSPGFPPASSGCVRKILGFLLTVKHPPRFESMVPEVSAAHQRRKFAVPSVFLAPSPPELITFHHAENSRAALELRLMPSP